MSVGTAGVRIHVCRDDPDPVVRIRPGPKPRKPRAEPARTKPSTAGFAMTKAVVNEEHVSELLCALAVERRENESLRKYNEWLTHRVQTLEMQLTRK